jgi:hypothetical protein
MNARFALAVAVVSALMGGAVGVLSAGVNEDSTALSAVGAVLAVVAVLGLVALGRAVVLDERDRSSGGR